VGCWLRSTQSGTFVVGDFFKINQNGFAFTESAVTPAPIAVGTESSAADSLSSSTSASSSSAAAYALPPATSNASFPPTAHSSASTSPASSLATTRSVSPAATPLHSTSPATATAGASDSGASASSSHNASANGALSGSGHSTRRLVVASLHDIEPLHAVGQGASGVVRRARHRPTGTVVALKVSRIFCADLCDGSHVLVVCCALKIVPIDLSATKSSQVVMELKTLYQCHSPYIISFMGAFYKDRAISLVME
jgi:hypothetical protein